MAGPFDGGIARALGKGLRRLFKPATLTKVTPGTRDPDNPAGGTNPTSASHPCRAIIETSQRVEAGSASAIIQEGVATLLAATLPRGVEPAVDDRLTIEGATYEVVGPVGRDPAAAVFEFAVRST